MNLGEDYDEYSKNSIKRRNILELCVGKFIDDEVLQLATEVTCFSMIHLGYHPSTKLPPAGREMRQVFYPQRKRLYERTFVVFYIKNY